MATSERPSSELFNGMSHVEHVVTVLDTAPWRQGPGGTISLDGVIKHVVDTLCASGIRMYDNPESGLQRILGDLASIGWVREAFGGTVMDSAASASTPIPCSQVDELDTLARLSAGLAVGILRVNGEARQRSHKLTMALLRGAPDGPALSPYWTEKVRANTKGKGFGQAAVTSALIAWHVHGLTGASAEAQTIGLLGAVDVDRLRRVADHSRADYLSRRAIDMLGRPEDLAAVERTIAELAARAIAAPEPSAPERSWPLRSSLEDMVAMEEDAKRMARSAGVIGVEAARQIAGIALDRAYETLTGPGASIPGSEWRRIVEDAIASYRATGFLTWASPDGALPDVEDPAPSGCAAVDDDRTAVRSRRIARRAAATLRQRALDDPDAVLALRALMDAGTLMDQAGTTDVSTRIRTWLDRHSNGPGTLANESERRRQHRAVIGLLAEAFEVAARGSDS